MRDQEQYELEHMAILRATAKKQKGKLITTEFLGADGKAKYEFECAEGHRWLANYYNITARGSWCLECSSAKRHTLADAQADAAAKGGKCLATEYRGVLAKYEWECSEGHRWTATHNNIRGGSWCPKHAGNAPLTLQVLQDAAKAHGGECLDTEYRGSTAIYQWRCAKGHLFSLPGGDVKRTDNKRRWCPVCKHSTPVTPKAGKERQ